MNEHAARTLYDVLGVATDASAGEIRRAYLDLVLAIHPDKAKPEASTTRASEVTAAYAVLADAGRRAAYDASLRTAGPRRGRPTVEVDLGAFTAWSTPDGGELFVLPCRCGAAFAVSAEELDLNLRPEASHSTVATACPGCSSRVNVAYGAE